jgi:hypothetical protein
MLSPFSAFNGESRDDEEADAQSQTDRQADVAGPGRSGLLNRPRRALDSDQRPRHRMVGYNVQTAVDTKHHMIVAYEVTNVGHDREQLSPMSYQTRDAID